MTDDTILTAARRVLETEADALRQLGESLGQAFAEAVTAIHRSEGRVVVAGVGKSGHVGRKIAATLASTGTLSLFVHPTEASHGDLGMIGAGDICLLLSNSGETTELGDLIAYCRRFAIPIIAVTAREGSTLGRAATHALILPPAPEACPIHMAPTTSTTMTLALGDAMAVALMQMRGFTRETFSVFHPGGKLGAQLARVGAVMHGGDEVPRVGEATPMGETLIEMTSKGFGIAAVVGEDGHLSGIVTDGDLRRNMADLMAQRAGDIATRAPVTVGTETLAAEALAILERNRISVLIVVDAAGTPVGVVHFHDLLRSGAA